MENLTILFSNKEKLHKFMIWFCNSGEQDYWSSVENEDLYEDDILPNDIVQSFDYDFQNQIINESENGESR